MEKVFHVGVVEGRWFPLAKMKKYQCYKPSKWEERIDKAFGLLSPRAALNRMVARERTNWFRYLAAQPTTSRKNSPSTSAGEWLKIQREKLQVMWNAINMVSNSGLCTGILFKFPTYVCGTLGWQARTGDKTINEMYQNYIKAKTCKPANIDVTRRHTLRQMCMLDIKSIALKGDVATNIVRGDDGELYLQGIEADRIGDPYRWDTSNRYVRGLCLDEVGGIEAVRVYYQDRRSGTYRFDAEFPTRDANGLPNFLFFNNPIDFDNYRGISLFQHAIDNSTYIDRMRQYELQALLWAASQSGVYYTKSGGLPEALPFSRTPITDTQGNVIETYEARPNTISALSADGEKVEMFQHDRPSPNVIGMYENTVRDIAIGAGLTYGFCYDMTGLTGPAVRQCSAQDARAIQIWQQMLTEQKLDPVIMLLLGTAIANGELPYIDTWMLWSWFFPPKPTIDVGRESDANIQEINACVNTGASVVADAGMGDVQEVITQRGHEVEMQIEAAMQVAQRLGLDWKEVHAFMIPPPRGSGKGGALAAAQGAAAMLNGQKADQAGATGEPAQLDDDGSSARFAGNGHNPLVVQHFYRPDQARDKGGKWEDEGKGSQEPGYISPGQQGGAGTAVAEKKTEVAPAAAAKMTPLTGMDKRLVDYKPDRSLSDPAKVTPINKFLPSIDFTPYTQTPFYQRVNTMMGMMKPENYDIGEYVKARDELFNTLPVTQIPIKGSKFVATQEPVNTDRVQQIIDHPETGGDKPVQAVKSGGKIYFLNGHHRLAAEVKKGEGELPGHVLDLDMPAPEPARSDDDVPRFISDLHHLPEYYTNAARMQKYGSDVGQRETWSLRQNTVDHTINGEPTPERKALYEKIITDDLGKGKPVPEGERPQAVMIIGKPASGKTFASKDFVSHIPNIVTINTDDVAARIPEYRGWNRGAVQEEASRIVKELTARAVAGRNNISIDETGAKMSKAEAKVKVLHDLGYDVHLIHVSAPMYQSANKVIDRYKQEGRFTDLDYLVNHVDELTDKTYAGLRSSPYLKSGQDIDNTDFKRKVTDSWEN